MDIDHRTGFTKKMYLLCEIAPNRVKGYRPTDFRKALDSAGADFSARAKEFLKGPLQSGLERLAEGRALDISMEWSIAYDNWAEFDESERRAAHDRLVLVSKMAGLPAPPPLR